MELQLKCLLFLFLVVPSTPQLISPCPSVFQYERSESDRWYGVVTLLSPSELFGVWLDIVFDKQTVQLGNWFGEIVTSDNKVYLVKNPKHKLRANQPYKIRFYVTYNPHETPPKVTMLGINGKTICPEGSTTTNAPVTPGHFTSSILATTENVNNNNAVGHRPGGASNHQPQPAALNNLACGTVINSPQPLITHGQAAHEAEFPWHAALYHSRGADLKYICGASLVTPQHLITVAHCVTTRKSQKTLNPQNLVVYLGKFYLRNWSNPGIQDKHASKITVHPKYNSQTYSNDLAVLKLAEPVQVTNYVRPVCLWEEDLHLQAVIKKAGTVVGWGFDENGVVTEELTKARMPVVSQEACIYSDPDFYSRFTTSKTFCAGFRNGTSVCNGDSGGGMVFPKTTSSPQNPVWQLRGVVSLSAALQNPVRCDSTRYAVFTDVAKYLDWVRASLT